VILLESFKFQICFSIDNLLYHVFLNDFPAPLLRTFEDVTLARLLDLVLKKVFVRLSAKLVATLLLSYEKLVDWMVNIANIAEKKLFA
jgi:hypothetical protein